MIEEKLRLIGLSKKETQIYILCLRLGLQPAGNISRRTKISRATVYDVFNSLIKKGLANKTDKGGVIYFEVISPENLLEYLEREKNDFIRKKDREKKEISEIIPLLKSIEIEKTSRPKVKFFEGKKGLKEAYETTLASEGDIRSYANVETVHKTLPNFFPDYYKRRAAKNIFIKAIFPDNDLGKDRKTYDEEEYRHAKLIDKDEYTFSPEVNIFNDKVLYSSWDEQMAVLIESEEIADFHKKMFDLLWKKLN